MKIAACLGIMPPRTKSGGVREGEGEREAPLRSVSAGSQSYEGFFEKIRR